MYTDLGKKRKHRKGKILSALTSSISFVYACIMFTMFYFFKNYNQLIYYVGLTGQFKNNY